MHFGGHVHRLIRLKRIGVAVTGIGVGISAAFGATNSNVISSRAPIEMLSGSGLEQWQSSSGGPSSWNKTGTNGVKIRPFSGHLVSRQLFYDIELHLEFLIPANATNASSGVRIQDRYEILIADSFGDTNLTTNTCGAIAGLRAPVTNACLAPGKWQTMDIRFRGAIWDVVTIERGATVVVHLNGTLIHPTGGVRPTPGGKHESINPGPLVLLDKGHAVQFRNIRLTPIRDDPLFGWLRRAGGDVESPGVSYAEELATSIALDGKGNLYVAGYFRGESDFGPTNVMSLGGEDAFLAKYHTKGSLQWVVTGGGPADDRFNSVAVAPDGSVVVAGCVQSNAFFGGSNLAGNGTNDIVVANYDPEGALGWVRAYGGAVTIRHTRWRSMSRVASS